MRTTKWTVVAVVFSCVVPAMVATAQSDRIVGGTHASEGEYPWMVEMLFTDDQHLCGATLIHPEWVITAGHCALVGDGANMRLIANSLNNTTALPGPLAEELLVDTIYYHPEYDGLYGPDLALIKLAQPAITPVVPLYPPDITDGLAPGDPALALGWGNADTSIIGPSDTLREVIVPLVGFDDCAALYVGSSSDLFNLNGTTGLLCAAGDAGAPALGSGNGDSGGPLLIELQGVQHQVGVVYGGEGQYATAEYPGVYTSVPHNWTWIQSTINGTTQVQEPSRPVKEAQVFTGPDGLRVLLPMGQCSALVDVWSTDGRLMEHTAVIGERSTVPMPSLGATVFLVRVSSPEGRTLFSGPVVRTW